MFQTRNRPWVAAQTIKISARGDDGTGHAGARIASGLCLEIIGVTVNNQSARGNVGNTAAN
jgi:hypothetical protein